MLILRQFLRPMPMKMMTRNPISINPDLLENPDTTTKTIKAKSDRLKAQLSVANTAFSKIRANRKKVPSTVADSLRERLEADGWSDEKIEELTKDGVSKKSMYQVLTKGSSGSKMILQKTSANERDLLANIWGAIALSNAMQFDVLEMLELNAALSATNLAANSKADKQELDIVIKGKNSGR